MANLLHKKLEQATETMPKATAPRAICGADMAPITVLAINLISHRPFTDKITGPKARQAQQPAPWVAKAKWVATKG